MQKLNPKHESKGKKKPKKHPTLVLSLQNLCSTKIIKIATNLQNALRGQTDKQKKQKETKPNNSDGIQTQNKKHNPQQNQSLFSPPPHWLTKHQNLLIQSSPELSVRNFLFTTTTTTTTVLLQTQAPNLSSLFLFFFFFFLNLFSKYPPNSPKIVPKLTTFNESV
jgi:hypothetical protein